MFLSYSCYDWKAKTPDTRQRSGVLFYAMQQKSPRNSEALFDGCIYPFWKLPSILSYFFGHVNSFMKNTSFRTPCPADDGLALLRTIRQRLDACRTDFLDHLIRQTDIPRIGNRLG
jgi:hypothetical protein